VQAAQGPSQTQDAATTPARAPAPSKTSPEETPGAAPPLEPPTEEELRRYNFAPNEVCPYCGITPEHPRGLRGLHWHLHWRRVGLREYITTPVVAAIGYGVNALLPRQTHAYWTGPILFDKPLRNALVLRSQKARTTASRVTDALLYASVAYPYVVDDLAVAWLGRQSPDVAWQMFVIDTQAFSLSYAMYNITKRVTGRERPYAAQCSTNPNASGCGSTNRFRSFFSGHTTMTATGAALICAHHTQLRLYRDPVADAATCVTAVGVTTATAVLRMASDNHWATDVLMGHLMGYVSGYLLPTLLYYKEFHFKPPPGPGERTLAPPRVAVLPAWSDGLIGLQAIGMF
jgi:membrane-associated phospholipid phosphatase